MYNYMQFFSFNLNSPKYPDFVYFYDDQEHYGKKEKSIMFMIIQKKYAENKL